MKNYVFLTIAFALLSIEVSIAQGLYTSKVEITPISFELTYYSAGLNPNWKSSGIFGYAVIPKLNGLEIGLGGRPTSATDDGAFFTAGYLPMLVEERSNWLLGLGSGFAAYSTIKDFGPNFGYELGIQGNAHYLGKNFLWLNYLRLGYGEFKVASDVVDFGMTLYVQSGIQFRLTDSIWATAWSSYYSNGGWINYSAVGLVYYFPR